MGQNYIIIIIIIINSEVKIKFYHKIDYYCMHSVIPVLIELKMQVNEAQS